MNIDPAVLAQLAAAVAGFTALWRKIGERDVQLGERLATLTTTVAELRATVKDEARGVADIRLKQTEHTQLLAQLRSDYAAIRAELDALEMREHDVSRQLAAVGVQLESIANDVESARGRDR